MRFKVLGITGCLVALTAVAATTYTTHYNLAKPADGSINYGSLIRDNFDSIDSELNANKNSIDNHISDTTAAHAASAISSTAGASLCTAALTVQAFLDCIDSNIGPVLTGGAVTLAGSQTLTGSNTFTSAIQASAGVNGDLTGNVTGNVTGNISGATGIFTQTVSTPSLTNSGTLTLPTDTDTLVGRDTVDTLTNKTLAVGSNTISSTASRAAQFGAGGALAASSVTSTELGYVSGVTSALQTQLDAKQALDSDLTAVAGLSTNGMMARTATGTAATRTITGTSNKITVTNGDGVAGDPTLTVGSDIVQLTSSQTLTNKTLTSPIISTISNTGTLTLPTSTDTLVGKATTDTLTNKTLTSPVISSISNTGTLTLPTSTDTLVGRATTDTLTNKYLQGGTASTTNRIKLPADTTTNLNTLASSLSAGDIVYDSSVGAIKYKDGSALQTLASGSLSAAAVGSSPNANGVSVSALQITLQPADATNPGVVTTGTQTIAGAKTFTGAHTLSGGLVVGTGGTANTTSDSNLGTIASVTQSAFYEGSYSYSFNLGWASTHGVTLYYQKRGTWVCLMFPETTFLADNPSPGAKISSSSDFLPSNLRPTINNHGQLIQIYDNGANQSTPGFMYLRTTGLIEIYRLPNLTTLYTANTQIGFAGFHTCYKSN